MARSDREARALALLEGQTRGVGADLARLALTGLALAYRVGLEIYLLPYRVGVRRQFRVACPVVSIGNLTTGGTGKTALVLEVCRLLVARGVRVCILNRGYRGGCENVATVASDGKGQILAAAQAGDEAHLLATNLPAVPVVVGRDRRDTARLAVNRFAPDLLVLDDGMQYYQLHRDLEIVLLDAERPFHNGWVLPRGLLREPPSHLERAGCVVLTNGDAVSADAITALRREVTRLSPRAALSVARYMPTEVRWLPAGTQSDPATLAGRNAVTVCGLGNPGSFERLVRNLGVNVLACERLADHGLLDQAGWQQLAARAASLGATALLTTQKDAVKIPSIDAGLPIGVVAVHLEISEVDEMVSQIVALAGRGR